MNGFPDVNGQADFQLFQSAKPQHAIRRVKEKQWMPWFFVSVFSNNTKKWQLEYLR